MRKPCGEWYLPPGKCQAISTITEGIISISHPAPLSSRTRIPQTSSPLVDKSQATQAALLQIRRSEAPFRSDRVCLGLTLIGPQTLYTKHRHPAIELYHVVAGTAAWTLDDVSRDNQPGTYILHPSQAVHAMQTRAQPLLAIYFWSGTDVRTASVYVDSSRAEETGQAN